MNEPSPSEAPVLGSDRSFGLVFAAVFAFIGLVPLLHGGDARLWAVGISATFALIAFFAAALLHPLNKLWFRFGLLLHRIMSPLIMSVMFFAAVVPVGLLMRLSGKDPLRLKRNRDAKSYWIPRDPPGPAPESLKNQF